MTLFRTALTYNLQRADSSGTDPQMNDPRVRSLAERFRKAARRADLAAPEVFDPNAYPNPNQVAAYFDNPNPSSPAERRFEESCQKSDSLMAEAFCCSEILRNWQEKPVRAPRSCRMRLYAIDDNPSEPEPLEPDADLIPIRRPADGYSDKGHSAGGYPAKDYSADAASGRGLRENSPFFYPDSDTASDFSASDLAATGPSGPSETAPSKKEESPASGPSAARSLLGRLGKGLEAVILTTLIFGLLLWLIPAARSRFTAPKPVQTAETPSPASSSTEPGIDSRIEPGIESAGETASESAAPQTDASLSSDSSREPRPERLSLGGTGSPNHSSVFTIPAQNNDVFRR